MERQARLSNVFGAPPAGEAGDGARQAAFQPSWRRKVLVVALAASVAIATQALLSSLQSGVEVRARLAIDRMSATESAADSEFLSAQVKLITSRDALRRAATELGVTDVGAVAKPPLHLSLLAAVGMGNAGKLVSPDEKLTEALAAGFSAAPSGYGRLIDIRFSAENRDFAIRFVNRVIDDYLMLQGTDGGVGARLVSGATPVEQTVSVPPWMGGAFAGLSVLALGAAAAANRRWRRREVGELPEEAPLAVGASEPVASKSADLETPAAKAEVAKLAAAVAASPASGLVDLAERRRVAVASFGEGGENRRLIEELARDGGFKGARIVVVDASRRIEDQPGLAELLAGEADFTDAIQRNASSRAHEIGPGRRSLGALADDAESVAMLLETLEQTYDLVLIDLGRLRADPAFSLFARLAGQLMLTGEADSTAVDTLLAALGRRGVTSITRVAMPAGEIAA